MILAKCIGFDILTWVKLWVDRGFALFVFTPHSFSQITKQLQRTFVPRRAGRRE
jgi:hypothetical protein